MSRILHALLPLALPAVAWAGGAEDERVESGILVDGGCSACSETVAALGGTLHASSTLASKDGRYDAKNLLDDDPRTAWCEGADGPGVGEWVELRFPAPVSLAELHLLTGYGKSIDTLRDNGRVQVIRVEVDGAVVGRILPYDIARPRDPSVGDAEWLADLHRFGAIAWQAQLNTAGTPTGARIRFVIEAVYPGDRYADTCLSTLRPLFPPRE
jgi:hypothetical protein